MSRDPGDCAGAPGDVPGIGASNPRAGPDSDGAAAAIAPDARDAVGAEMMGLSAVGASSTAWGAGEAAAMGSTAAAGTAAAIDPVPVTRGTAEAALTGAGAGSAGRAVSAAGAASSLAPQPRQNL